MPLKLLLAASLAALLMVQTAKSGSLRAADPPLEAFPETIEVDNKAKTVLRRNGMGLCEWGLFQVDLYWAALYLEKPSANADLIIQSPQAKRIHLHLSRALSRSQLQDAYKAAFKANAGKELPVYEERLKRLNGMMKDLEQGDSMIFTYLPGDGLRVEIAGKEAGTIPGEDFGRMFFQLYLGAHSPDEDLREGLLGPEKEGK